VRVRVLVCEGKHECACEGKHECVCECAYHFASLSAPTVQMLRWAVSGSEKDVLQADSTMSVPSEQIRGGVSTDSNRVIVGTMSGNVITMDFASGACHVPRVVCVVRYAVCSVCRSNSCSRFLPCLHFVPTLLRVVFFFSPPLSLRAHLPETDAE
jgi:hypothetical protein